MARRERHDFRGDYDWTYGALPEEEQNLAGEEPWWPEYDAEFRDWSRVRRARGRGYRDEDREAGYRGGERRHRRRRAEDDPRRQGGYPGHPVPPDFRRYLSAGEYGLGESGYGRDYQGSPPPAGRARRRAQSDEVERARVTRRRNALFGGEGFRRYDRDYDEP